MQDLLRQRGNTAELCSLCCQHSCKGGGERILEEEEREEEERECKQCHSVQEAMLQSTLPRHEDTAPAPSRLKVSQPPIRTSPPDRRAGTVLSSSLPSARLSLICLRRPEMGFAGVDVCASVCKLLLPPLQQPGAGSRSAANVSHPCLTHGSQAANSSGREQLLRLEEAEVVKATFRFNGV